MWGIVERLIAGICGEWGIGVVMMCIVSVGKEADCEMMKFKRKRGQLNEFRSKFIQWFLSNAQSLVLMAIVVIGIYLGFKREFSKLIGSW